MTDGTSTKLRHPYTAFVIGSGCSVGLGVPVMAGFLDKVIEDLARDQTSESQQELGTIRSFIGVVKGSGAYVRTDLLNIEEMYGLADMAEDLDRSIGEDHRHLDSQGHKAKEAFNRAIYRTAKDAGKELLPSSNGLPTKLGDLETIKRESHAEPLHAYLGDKHTTLLAYLCLTSFQDPDRSYPLFIQFNWDLALDRAIVRFLVLKHGQATDTSPIRWYEPTGEFDYSQCPRIARPHGGINWIDCQTARSDPKNQFEGCVPNNGTDASYVRIPDEGKNEIWLDSGAIASANRMNSRTYSQNTAGTHMAIVPPTWRKQASLPAYEHQWGVIRKALRGIRRLVFIGYSLPKTDLYFRYFLALALAENNHLPKVYVVNPGIESQGTVRDNYLDLFAPLAREGRLYGIAGRFGEPALFDLHRAFYIAERITP